LRLILLLIAAVSLAGCAFGGPAVKTKPQKPEHVYLEPITNRTTEEGLDVLFTQVADEAFYSDPRFKVDLTPTPDLTVVIKPSIDSVSSTPVGFDEKDTAREYQLTVRATVKLKKFGYRKPFAQFTITRYDFYDAYGTPSEVEEKRKECLRRIARQIFQEVGERLYVEESENIRKQQLPNR